MEQHYTSDKSSDASVNKNRVALTLDQRRRAALEEVDNASFSLVQLRVSINDLHC